MIRSVTLAAALLALGGGLAAADEPRPLRGVVRTDAGDVYFDQETDEPGVSRRLAVPERLAPLFERVADRRVADRRVAVRGVVDGSSLRVTPEPLAGRLVADGSGFALARGEVRAAIVGRPRWRSQYVNWRVLLRALAEADHDVRLSLSLVRDAATGAPLAGYFHHALARVRADAAADERKLWVTVGVPAGSHATAGAEVAVLGAGALSGAHRVRVAPEDATGWVPGQADLGWIGPDALDYDLAGEDGGEGPPAGGLADRLGVLGD